VIIDNFVNLLRIIEFTLQTGIFITSRSSLREIQDGEEAESLNSVTLKTSLQCWSHTWVILTASNQNNSYYHTRCRKKFKE
jgi:hypothetical protein